MEAAFVYWELSIDLVHLLYAGSVLNLKHAQVKFYRAFAEGRLRAEPESLETCLGLDSHALLYVTA